MISCHAPGDSEAVGTRSSAVCPAWQSGFIHDRWQFVQRPPLHRSFESLHLAVYHGADFLNQLIKSAGVAGPDAAPPADHGEEQYAAQLKSFFYRASSLRVSQVISRTSKWIWNEHDRLVPSVMLVTDPHFNMMHAFPSQTGARGLFVLRHKMHVAMWASTYAKHSIVRWGIKGQRGSNSKHNDKITLFT